MRPRIYPDDRVRRTTRLMVQTDAKLIAYAKTKGLSINEALAQLLDKALESQHEQAE